MIRILIALSMGIPGFISSTYAQTADPCSAQISRALQSLRGSGYNEVECKLKLSQRSEVTESDVVSEAYAECWHHISPISVEHTFSQWQVHFDPNTCAVLGITRAGAPQ